MEHKQINYNCDFCKKLIRFYKSTRKSNKENFCSLKCSYEKRKFDKFNLIKPTINKLKNSNFIIWFTGFWEGEGSLSTSEKLRSPHLMVSQNDKEIIQQIFKTFSFGHVSIQQASKLSNNKCWQYRADSLIEIAGILWLMKPYLKISKRLNQVEKATKLFKLQQYIDWFEND